VLDDLDEVLGELLVRAGMRKVGGGRRTRGCLRAFFGLLLAGLSVAGVWKTMTYDASLHFRLAGAALFAALALFAVVNVLLLRRTRLPGCLVLLAFFALFAVRILLGP